MAYTPSEVPDLYPKFTNGEQCLGPIDQMDAPALTSFYFARLFDTLPAGRYVIKMTADDAATVWVGTDITSSRMVGSCRLDAEVTAFEFEFDLYEGERRFDVYLQNLSEESSHCGFIFGLYRDGVLVYASRAANWLYDTAAPIPDAELLGGIDMRRLKPVFTVLPNWKDGILERVEYLTDVLTSERATEQRRALRSKPRRSIEANFARTRAIQDRLVNFFTGTGAQPFLVPLWFEQRRLGVTVSPATTTLAFPSGDLAQREFREGDTAIIIDKNPDVFDIIEIGTVDLLTQSIELVSGITQEWGDSARIIPLRLARLIDRPSMSNRTDEVGTTAVRFELLDGDIGGSSWGFCVPLLKLEPNWAQSVEHGYERLIFSMDNQIASPYMVDPSDQTLVTLRANYTLRFRDQVRYLRDFINEAKGRAMRFYAPTYTDDLQPIDPDEIPGGVNYFDIQPSGLWEGTRTRQFSRRTVGFFFNDGSPPFFREVEDIQPVGLSGPPYRMSAERLYVNMTMPPVNMRDIKRISWMQVVRFDQDGFELKHVVDDSVAVTAALVLRGVDPEGMPPIECIVTSRPYPVDDVEVMTSTQAIIGGRIYEPVITLPPESVTSQHSVIGMNLRNVLTQYSMEPEAFAAQHTVSAITLRQVLRSYTMQPEAMNVTASLNDGTLRVALITYSNWPAEGMDITAQLTGGTLA